ncbi:complexin-like [Haliotis rubra]|uniref:complexin-like n=1 Tax=Haliotis rubra TaxID=36100 RepID=UPI001EE591FC|nr:complexin-like [Haliotis rubra]XP_046557232.1 complexin-like [Haliotis rubra]XP_046557233.1 complexin-like [Haliotis rubra]XP_046557234.1 complexin-like [Haliotis rubra]XP_046557235.1 complexin-like [Haliotis rubra]XP_046557236.1 complexin-like [Haliotis rubra]XP_046557237.1 complexin-like [Haliotis rubra]XP_046557238.1 complexin-like [Haliotis rubra]XP_046557239.1 complexin-like [Haliotis rubra]XP_046557240.1 complexin-like [Haliotis rubra]
MAAFIAKQMVGNQLKSVTGAMGDKDEEKKNEEGDEDEDPEIAEARREAEEKRKDKHRKMEEEREELRQSIRDKYGLKKKEKTPEEEVAQPLAEGRIGRKKKTPAELEAENNADSDDDELSSFPKNLTELQSKVSELPTKLAAGVGEVTQKCVVQ